MEFTKEQLENWKKFENVRESGVINMLDARTGCDITEMSKDEWLFCMTNYSALEKVYNAQEVK